MSDSWRNELITKGAAFDALGEEPEVWTGRDEYAQGLNNQWHYDVNALKALPSAQPQLDTCPIYGGMCGYPSNLCYECPRHEGAKEQPQWWTEGLQPFAQPQWIPVTERLPEYGTEVVTINKDDEYEINHVIDEEDGEWFFDGAVAWMPLPEPYKGEQE